MHHIPLCIIVNFYAYNQIQNSDRIIYNFKYCNYDVINDLINSVDWIDLFLEENLFQCYDLFLMKMSEFFSLYVPRTNGRVYKLPWYTKGLKKLKNLRNKFFRKYRSGNNHEHLRLYKHYLREFNFLNRYLYNQYIIGFEDSITVNPKSFWSFINSKRGKSSIPSSVFYKDNVSSSSTQSANLFAQYFESNFTLPSANFDSSVLDNIRSAGQFSNVQLSISDVVSAISVLKNSLGCDSDGLCSYFIKNCCSSICLPLQLIFNKSLKLGIFLDKWKLSSITPVFKSGNKCNVENYRPISKLSTVSKLFEHAIIKKLYFFIEPIIIEEQHGFLRGRSTTTNLAVFNHYCISNFKIGYQVDTIYTDYSKAFDKISHNILLAKLDRIGFNSNFLNWLSSYLHNRVCYVNIDDYLSSPYVATSGVPQGSVLGPLLFCIYMNDISSCFNNCKFLLYADDIKIFYRVKCGQDALDLQKNLDNLVSWSDRNKLLFNIDKCFYLRFHKVRHTVFFKYSIHSIFLHEVYDIMDLGVIFDSKLTFINHLNYIIPKSFSLLAFVKRNSTEFANQFTRKILYFSFVRSVLEYASIIWSPCYIIHINRLERVQRKFTKFALSLNIVDYNHMFSYITRCNKLDIQTLESRRSFQSILFLFDVINYNIKCPELLSYININVPSRSLRYHDYFFIGYHKTNYSLNEPLIRAKKMFNKLNENYVLDFSFSKEKFKLYLKNLL